MTPAGAARVIGVISDTHGLLRAGVHAALAGVELILETRGAAHSRAISDALRGAGYEVESRTVE